MIKKKLREILHRLRGETPTENYIARGMKVGKNLTRLGGVIFDYSHCWHITIGDNVTLAPRVHILAHDASTHNLFGYTRVGNVKIGNNVFIGASSVVLPNVEIGDDCIIGANSTVTKSIPAGMVAAGSPARVLCTVDEFKERVKSQIDKSVLLGDEYTERLGVDSEKKRQMVELCDKNGYIFVK